MGDGLTKLRAARLPRAGTRRLARVLGGVVVAVAPMGALAAPAFADSAVISVTNTAGESDPAADLPRVFTVSGATAAPEEIFVKSRAIGGAPCAPSAHSDTGERVGGEFSSLAWGTEVNGAFSLNRVYTWRPPGPELFCIWIGGNENSITTPISQVITFRSPSGTISASINPPVPKPGEKATLTVLGTSEAPERAFAKVRPAGGAACAPNFSGDTGAALLDEYGDEVNGAYQLQDTFSEANAGNYVLCLWLASSSSSIPAIAGPQPIPFSVGNPPPPPSPPPPPPSCVVPSFSSRMSLATVEHRIRAGHCRVGRIRYAHARRVRRGRVIALTPRVRSYLANGSRVAILVSLGHHHR